jgi:TolA-binding protein
MDVVNSELQALGERLTTMARHLQELTTRLAATSPVEQAPPAASAVTPAPEAGALAAAPSASAPEAEAPAAAPSAPAREAEAPAAAPAPVPTPAPAPTQSGEPTPAPDSRLATAVEPQRLYNSGYTDYGRGNYALAIGAFREFIRRYPTDEMAGNAQYWIAEAYLGLAHRYANGGETERAAAAFDQAIEAFQAVGQRYPRSDKAPAALFREAGCHLEVGQADRARERLEYLVEHFPTAPEARLARQRLADGAKP